jgi:ABC-type cobalamin/Fe3+-siderophores transport system ATPase subunit
MLDIKSLSVAYGTRLVLHEVSFELPSGCMLAVIGPNGAGKTTLIRALTGILIPQSGQILIDGRDINHLTAAERARRIAVVPQARQLPPAFTAWETVLLGRTPHLNWLGQTSRRDEEITRQAMERTHTLELAERPVGELSGGEQQRLLLARALAQAAPILLMDEPTAHLDLKYQYSLLEEVRLLAQKDRLSVLVVLHDLNLVARYADQAALLVDGKLRALGPTTEVLTGDVLSEAYQVPLEVLHAGKGGEAYVIPAFR